jgi:hypothetical protein
MKISKKKFSFFSTLNQYFPHIPYVASKKRIPCRFIVYATGASTLISFRWVKHKISHPQRKNIEIEIVYTHLSSISIILFFSTFSRGHQTTNRSKLLNREEEKFAVDHTTRFHEMKFSGFFSVFARWQIYRLNKIIDKTWSGFSFGSICGAQLCSTVVI